MDYKCEKCGNDTLFYNEISLVAKEVFNQKTGKVYIRDKTNIKDNFFEPTYCKKCDHCVAQ